MADCFISYAKADHEIVEVVAAELRKNGVKPFVASTSIEAGDAWNAKISGALRESEWVIYMAGKSSAQSPYVQQEIGAAIFGGKTLIPVIWDIAPEELPGWSKNYQAIDLRGKTQEEIGAQIRVLSKKIPTEIGWGGVLAAALTVGAAGLVGKALLSDART